MGDCTGWVDWFLWWNWSACCRIHDSDYALGVVKPIADYFLQACVNNVLPGMGHVMWIGLSIIFGWVSKYFYEQAQQRRERSEAP